MTRTEQRQAMRASGPWRGSKAGRTRRHVVNFRGWSGLENWHAPKAPPPYSPRLSDRVGLVLTAASSLGVEAERFGLGAYLVAIGRSVLDAGLIVPDGLDDETLAHLTAWARAHPVETTSGPKPWKVVTLSDFYDPRHGVFVQRAYCGAGWCIGADLGRVFGLAAEHSGARLGQNARTWEAWLPGWGKEHEHGRWKRVSPHRPPLRVEARRVGWQIAFGPCEKGCGKRIDGRTWSGAFVDVLSLAYALDGDRGASLSEHRENFGLSPVELPVSVALDAVGAAQITQAVLAVHELAVTLDEHASQWFTTAEDRADGRGRLDLTRTVSPGGIAAQIPPRFGVRAPMDTFGLTDDEHRPWAETFHGGRCDADPSLLGVPFSAVTVDVSSCFPAVAHLIGWWELLCAEKIARRNATVALRRFCDRAANNPSLALDPAIFRRFGCCLVKVVPDGETFPVEVEDKLRPDGRLEVVPVYSPDRPLYFSALDVIAASIESGRAPEILEATAYVPHGRQAGLRKHLAILPGLVADIVDDPALLLVEHRRGAKDRGNLALAAELRVAVNSLVFGNFARFDELLRKDGRGWVTGEKPGPFTCLPLASSVTAGSHLLLAVFDRMVRVKAGIVAYKDTDSSIIPASPEGGDLALSDGSVVHELSHADVDEILRAFDALSPAPGWPVWKSERGTSEDPLQALVYGPKRHTQMLGDRIIDLTEAGLGGTYADPPTMRGRDAERYRHWSSAAVRREIAYTLDRRDDPDNALRSEAPWDAGAALPFPAFRRLMVKTPEMARSLPASLRARPGTRLIEASGAIWSGSSFGRTVVALDPGGDLANWRDLRWVETSTSEAVRVTTDPMELGSLILEALSERAIEWSRAPRSEPIEAVVVDPNLIAFKGRVSGVIDADADGLTDLRDRRPRHADADALAFIRDEVIRLGPSSFSGTFGIPLDTAKKLSSGRRPNPATTRQVFAALEAAEVSRTCDLDGCDAVVNRRNSLYCSTVHRNRAYRQRQKTLRQALDRFADRTCVGCGVVLLGAAVHGPCPVCSTMNDKGVA